MPKTRTRRSSLISCAIAILILSASAHAGKMHIEVDLSERSLIAYENDREIRRYEVAIGTEDFPTPTGDFSIDRMIWNPEWVPPKSEWAADAEPKAPGEPDNPMQVVKLYFKDPDYYIHGTNKPESVGTASSHGCLRMRDDDIYDLARLVMEHGGQRRPESWFRRLFRVRQSNRVHLTEPVPISIRE